VDEGSPIYAATRPGASPRFRHNATIAICFRGCGPMAGKALRSKDIQRCPTWLTPCQALRASWNRGALPLTTPPRRTEGVIPRHTVHRFPSLLQGKTGVQIDGWKRWSGGVFRGGEGGDVGMLGGSMTKESFSRRRHTPGRMEIEGFFQNRGYLY
jgi:hypothetical protein